MSSDFHPPASPGHMGQVVQRERERMKQLDVDVRPPAFLWYSYCRTDPSCKTYQDMNYCLVNVGKVTDAK